MSCSTKSGFKIVAAPWRARSFPLCTWDVDIYSATRDSLEFLADLLVPGGIIIVDDYGHTTCKGSKEAGGRFR